MIPYINEYNCRKKCIKTWATTHKKGQIGLCIKFKDNMIIKSVATL